MKKRGAIGVLILSMVFLFSLSFVSADYASCWENSNTDSDTCTGAGNCIWKTPAEDPWCDSYWNPNGCCMDIGCWQYDGTNSTWCEEDTLSYDVNCTWDPWMTMWYPNGTQGPTGGCMTNWAEGGGVWGGMAEGCWQYDGDKASCVSPSNAQDCTWIANDQNQDPWCWVDSLSSAQDHNADATVNDIGCCSQKGCWNHDGNESSCVAAFQGNCIYENSSWGEGWCMTKWCGEITTEDNCTYAAQTLYMPCTWDGDSCEDSYGDGGFGAYNDTDSCFEKGGWYNTTGDCVMPTGGDDFGGGGGGFMYAGDSHCWFADNQPTVCENVTGCVYCDDDGGLNGTTNTSSLNICARKQAGYCEGHDSSDSGTYNNAGLNNTANLACTDILLKSACIYGPLPNCKWTNTSSGVGAYCEAGASSQKKNAPPVPFCEHPDSKNNYTICSQLIEEFMMPCTWDNSTYPVKNCTFNSGAVFGTGEIDVGIVGSENACTASGGTWQTEYYIESDILKQDSWCEMTGFLDVDNGGQEGNKANCDTSCWACEFQSNGTAWGNVADVEAACIGSALGYCAWTDGSSAFNGFGYCDYPQEMSTGGSSDCNTNCEDCDFMIDAYGSCIGSVANNGTGCKWANESGTTAGYCVDKTKKICSGDCFSCYNVGDCQNSAINCSWDMTSNLCSPDGYNGEICFNGIDDDNDQMVDCGDPDCGFDNFCGGTAIGGDCFAQTTKAGCNATVSFGGLNCTWLNDTWNFDGWCDMPGANCWKFMGDLVTCGETPGCTNISTGMMGASAMCDVNMTKVNNANCWQYDYAGCVSGPADCQWKNDTWCAGDGAGTDWCDSNSGAGWCDYKPFATCMDLNVSTCGIGDNTNCTWQEDNYSMQGGWCQVACMNWSIGDQTQCEATGSGGLCEWRNMAETCQPEMFMMMGTAGTGGKTGCWQHDGNETGCNTANVTCTYKNDSYSNNNLSATEPSGWCMDKGEYQQFGDMDGGDVHQLAMDSGNAFGQYGPEAEPGVSDEVDIMGMGMRVSAEGLNFGAGIFNISDSIICNGRNVGAGMGMNGTVSAGTLGAGNSSGAFYWYLDTDGNETGGCNAIGDTTYAGYEFRISYIARNDSTLGIVETKQLMRCSSGSWTATNALVTTNKQMSCGEIGGVMVAVSSQDLESFSEFSKTANMRVYMASADSAGSRTVPSDYVGPGYYTPGSIDFGFVDCSNPNTKDPKCKNAQKFGFNVFEECMNGVDDNEDGLADCADPTCVFTPKCSSGASFNFSANVSDKVAPTVIFSKVDKLSDGAFMKIDTDEASNMSVQFYSTDSTCKILNSTVNDTGVETYQEYANFKPFHALDLIDSATSLGFDLINGTAYYYKIRTCDPSGNCAISACSNFTTKNSTTDKAFIFKLDLPAGYTVDIPALNKTAYNFTETFTINGVPTVFDVGIKTNTSMTKNMNFTVHSNCDDDLSIGFYGVNVYEPVKIDMSNAFICNAGANMMGMNSSLKKWNKLIDEMHLGGAADYIQMNVPVAYAAANTFNFVDDAGAGAQDVDDYVNCESGGTGVTACQVPVSLGF